MRLILFPPGRTRACRSRPPCRLTPRQPRRHGRCCGTLVGFYGTKTLSGQINEADTQYLQSITGKTPAIMGGDLIEYSPSRIAHGSDPKGETERLIRDAKAGQIITLLWHWNAPTDLIDQKTRVGTNGKTYDASWYRGFYTEFHNIRCPKSAGGPELGGL